MVYQGDFCLDTPVAIVGMSCMLPNASQLDVLWEHLLQGVDGFGEVPASRWDWRRYYSPDRGATDKTYCKVGAFFDGYVFPWRTYKLPPRVVEHLNPMHLVLIEATAQALADAGFPRRPDEPDRTGYLLGCLGMGITPDYGLRVRLDSYLENLVQAPAWRALPPATATQILGDGRAAIESHLAPIFEDDMLGGISSIAVGRAMAILGLRGPHYVVDAGYASSLAALGSAAQLLADGTCDQVLVGGASPYLQPLELIAFSRLGALAEREILPLDARAQGTIFGEGAGVLVLKRLEDAQRDGHRIYAVIRGVGSASNGTKQALFAPDAEAEALAFQRALTQAAWTPDDVQLVECHATGTPLGDAVEVDAIARVFGQRSRRLPPLHLGAIKELVGHLQAGAGMVGMIKTALALHHGVIPPQHRFREPQPEMQLRDRGLDVVRQPVRWQEQTAGAPARALVNSFGFGGINFAACVEAHRPGPASAQPRSHAPRRVETRSEPVAIIGMGGVFPGAADVATFWRNNVAGFDAIREVPRDRFDIDRYCDPSGNTRERSYTRLGAFVDLQPDARLARIPPRALPWLDGTQVLTLAASAEALADAGYPERPWSRDDTAVFIADMPQRQREWESSLRVSSPEYRAALEPVFERQGVAPALRDQILDAAEESFKAGFLPMTEDSIIGYLGGIIPGRVSKRYDFRGPNMVVEAACASSLHTLATAVRGLQQGQFAVALAGGVCTNITPEIFAMVCAFNGVSRSGISPFDARADGFLVGEGAGVVVLKRLRDAVRDGDRIRAVIRGIGESTDGHGRNVYAPNPAGQALAVQRAIEVAGVRPGDIDYIECHGTGTAVGDVSEVDAYARVYGRHGRPKPIALSSVKSMIGHLNAAAGVAGLIRAVCALEHCVIPPTLRFETPNPNVAFDAGPFEVATRAMPWPKVSGRSRRAAVSGFGLGGANAHVIIEDTAV
jgi:acyl transferase domain-containing protein